MTALLSFLRSEDFAAMIVWAIALVVLSFLAYLFISSIGGE